MPIVAFFLTTTDHPIDEDHPLWDHPLPEKRSSGLETPEAAHAGGITYGQYFSAVVQFCATGGWQRILNAASSKLKHPVSINDLKGVSIFLEKHGAFYHPARLQVTVKDQTLSFVVNVAPSSHGRQALQPELRALKQLNKQRPFGWLPTIYASVTDDIPMFLGDWFDGFHEFHLTRQPGGQEPAVMVWNRAERPCLLTVSQTTALYRNMAMILAACYDPVTTCQIFPWHHAAGDFIVRVDGRGAAVKLITVRDYVPLAGSTAAPENESDLLDALMVFFIQLTVRMRLDRLDGVSDVVWAPDHCLAPMSEGFFQGLDLTARINGFPETFPKAFRHYFNHHDGTDLLAMAHRITDTVFDQRSEERQVIDGNLTRHIERICRILSV